MEFPGKQTLTPAACVLPKQPKLFGAAMPSGNVWSLFVMAVFREVTCQGTSQMGCNREVIGDFLPGNLGF